MDTTPTLDDEVIESDVELPDTVSTGETDRERRARHRTEIQTLFATFNGTGFRHGGYVPYSDEESQALFALHDQHRLEWLNNPTQESIDRRAGEKVVFTPKYTPPEGKTEEDLKPRRPRGLNHQKGSQPVHGAPPPPRRRVR